eukprot:scaffold748_cov251-Pinguiococcus_pyrenoidosus.AAC.69
MQYEMYHSPIGQMVEASLSRKRGRDAMSPTTPTRKQPREYKLRRKPFMKGEASPTGDSELRAAC